MIKTKKSGSLIVVSGPSGAGKDTVCQELLKKNDNVSISISATTRLPRKNEIEGKDYYFITEKEFKEKINNDEFLEYAIYNNNYYGTLKNEVEKDLNKGLDVVLVIEVKGALKIKKLIKGAIFIFIVPPNMSELKRRLTSRGTETKDKILKRFKRAYKEINQINKYNYVVISDNQDNASNKLNAIIISEKCRVDRIEEIDVNNKEELIHELLVNFKK